MPLCRFSLLLHAVVASAVFVVAAVAATFVVVAAAPVVVKMEAVEALHLSGMQLGESLGALV